MEHQVLQAVEAAKEEKVVTVASEVSSKSTGRMFRVATIEPSLDVKEPTELEARTEDRA